MRDRRGFALMASLWLVVAIAALSLQISAGARDRRLAVANTLEDQRAHAAATSGVEHARARLARLADDGGGRRDWRDPQWLADPWHALDSTLRSETGNQRYDVRFHDLGGRLHVNRATAADLRRYFTGLRMDVVQAQTITDGILDWLDADDVARTRGAEHADYLRSGARELPRDGPVSSVEELRDVRGMTPELFRRISRDFAALGTGQVNVNSASRSVLLSLPGFTEAAADAVVREQANRRRIGSWTELMSVIPSQARAPLLAAAAELHTGIIYETREVGVESVGTVDGSPVRAVTEAVLARGGRTVFVTWSASR